MPQKSSQLLLLTGALLLSGSAISDDWLFVGADLRGNHWHIDRASIVRDSDVMILWERLSLKEPHIHPISGAVVNVALFREAIRCKERLAHVDKIVLIGQDNAVIAKYDHHGNGLSWPAGLPVSVTESKMALACF